MIANIATAPIPSSSSITETEDPKPLRWTKEEYYRLSDLGFFLARRVQLIDGEIYEMAAQKNRHALAISFADDALTAAFGPGYWVRIQMTLDLGPYSVPDPDVAVIEGSNQDHRQDVNNPTSALLIVEASETTLSFDRNTKADVYAAAGIADYWIIDLVHMRLEVRRNPVPDPTRRHGVGYGDLIVLTSQDEIAPLAMPTAKIQVADLLP